MIISYLFLVIRPYSLFSFLFHFSDIKLNMMVFFIGSKDFYKIFIINPFITELKSHFSCFLFRMPFNILIELLPAWYGFPNRIPVHR